MKRQTIVFRLKSDLVKINSKPKISKLFTICIQSGVYEEKF